eukprot:14276-Heterococcus_DN1.PRE.5
MRTYLCHHDKLSVYDCTSTDTNCVSRNKLTTVLSNKTSSYNFGHNTTDNQRDHTLHFQTTDSWQVHCMCTETLLTCTTATTTTRHASSGSLCSATSLGYTTNHSTSDFLSLFSSMATSPARHSCSTLANMPQLLQQQQCVYSRAAASAAIAAASVGARHRQSSGHFCLAASCALAALTATGSAAAAAAGAADTAAAGAATTAAALCGDVAGLLGLLK